MTTINTHPLQTKLWAEFRRKWGNEVLETPYGVITLHRIPPTKFKLGAFIKCPEPTKEMMKFLKELAKKENLIFIKMEPNVLKNDKTIKLLKDNGCVAGKTLFTPTSFWIDLTKSEEELLASFESKTRYNIRLSERKGVKVEEETGDKAFEKYLELTAETTKRDNFFAHNRHYHKLMWETLKGKIAHLLTAKFENEIIVTWILFESDGFLYYPYGGSTHNPKYKNLMASNLMMWEAIKFGKKLGLTTFDLWGREPGKGFTKFKEGYNPKVVEFVGTWDLVINKPLYNLYKVLERGRWMYLKSKKSLGLSKNNF